MALVLELATALRDHLGLDRAVETGTWHGDGARALGEVFPTVVSIELSEDLHGRALERLKRTSVELLHGDSVSHLPNLAGTGVPTFYFLDAHWSASDTAGVDDECPVVAEIQAIGTGHPRDCVVVDDARLFLAAPPPPHDPSKWPTIMEVFDAIRDQRPDHSVTVLADQVIAVPREAKPVVDEYGRSLTPRSWRSRLRSLGRRRA